MNQLTTIAALPGSGAGCMSALPAEKAEPKKTVRLTLHASIDPVESQKQCEALVERVKAGEISVSGAYKEMAKWVAANTKVAVNEVKRPTMSERTPALLKGMKEGFYSLEEGGLVRIGDAPCAHSYADRFKADERN